MTLESIVIRRFDGPGAAAQLDALLPAYEEVYAAPPYEEGPRDVAEFVELRPPDQHPPRVPPRTGDARRAGRRLCVRLLPAAATSWWQGSSSRARPTFVREDGRRTFAVIELAVRGPIRRRGIARQLHDELLAGLAAERVVLTVRPEPAAAPARCAYESWGYEFVGETRPQQDGPLYRSMMLSITPN
ncbi:GNAT family N-acetyltransferase [Streptomyces sp. N35]|uniref:GNAT family N-acetyltransferase n=1 Tax=Streptomyces sp. N35 TaxID=2795730 RepID=UPI0027DD1090|nr:GNAT family N-acetyltransferase [Streptomyces sp. N35]